VDVAERRRVIFLGDSIAVRLFPDGDAVGSTLHVDGLPFTVVGTMASKAQTSMNNGPDADRAIIPATTFRTIYGPRNVSHILVRPRDIREAEVVKRRLYEVLGARYAFDPDDTRALRIWDFVEEERITRRHLRWASRSSWAWWAPSPSSWPAWAWPTSCTWWSGSGPGRSGEAGRGRSPRHVMAQFIFEAVLICLTGGLAGLAVGAAIVGGVAALPDANEAMFFIGNPALPWPIVLARWGSWWASGSCRRVPRTKGRRLDPVESLRWE
jgi:putative ABC transport system permease protein